MRFKVRLLISLVAYFGSYGLVFGLLGQPYNPINTALAVILGSLLSALGRRFYTQHLESKKK